MSKTESSHKWSIFSLAAIGIFMATLDGSIVNIALPTIMADLHEKLVVIEWVVMIYLFTVSALLLSMGRLSDIKGRRWVYSRGLLLFAVGSLLCGLADSAFRLIGARFFQGFGAAMIMACTPALVVDIFPAAERGRALGMVGTVVASGLSIGPTLGGLILHFFSWRVIFYLNIPIGVITAVAALILLKGGRADTPRPDEVFDWPGAILLALCLGPLLLAISHGYDWGYGSGSFLSLIALAVISGLILALVESRVAYPVLDPAIIRIRLFTLPIIAAVFIFVSLFALVFLMPFYLLLARGLPVSQTGLFMSTIFLVLFIVSPLSGAISDRIGSRLLCMVGMGVLAAALFALAHIPPGAPPLAIIWRLALAGIGTALFMPPNSAAAMSAVPPQRRGLAGGTVAAARNLGMVLGIGMAGAIFNAVYANASGGASLQTYTAELRPAFMTAFHAAMNAGGGVALFGMLVSYLRGREKVDAR
jgi:EmrB/QacA subfamily drug resistance transporter